MRALAKKLLKKLAPNVSQLVVSAGLGERNLQIKNKLQWKNKF